MNLDVSDMEAWENFHKLYPDILKEQFMNLKNLNNKQWREIHGRVAGLSVSTDTKLDNNLTKWDNKLWRQIYERDNDIPVALSAAVKPKPDINFIRWSYDFHQMVNESLIHQAKEHT